jgi:uncharacterized protein DUF6441
MKMTVKADKSNAKVFDKTRRQLIAAAQGAVKDAAAEAVKQGRAQIAAAGFSARRQRGLQSKFLKGNREKPARLIFHRVAFMSVFERGATISGKPLLWLPIEENLPARVRSPRKYGGPLVSATIGGQPFLFSPKDYEKALFVGVKQATIRKRFSLRVLFQRIAAQLPEFLRKRLERMKSDGPSGE